LGGALALGLGFGVSLGGCSTSSGDRAPAPAPAPAGIPTNANPGESPASKEKPKDPSTQMALAIDAEDFSSAGYRLDAVFVTAKIDGVVAAEKTFDAEAGPLFPHEVHLVAPKDKPFAVVEVTVTASMNGQVVVTRHATTQFVPGTNKLLYLLLEIRCNNFALLGGGNVFGPNCTTPGETCVGAVCRSDRVSDLTDYAADWATNPPSRCGGSAPLASLEIGKGETAYASVVDGEMLTVECGPQGGHHIWLALRSAKLSQVRTITTISAVQPAPGVSAPATAFAYSWSPGPAGACELVGLRFQLDGGATMVTEFLGKPLDITVNAKDKSGHDITQVAHVNIAATPTGMFCH